MDSVNKLVVPFPRINFNMKNRFSYSSYDTIFQGGEGGYFLISGSWGCAAGWGRIFTTGLTIMLSLIHI